jgi:isopentenyl-diphosphate Delta-isomerase
MQKVTQTSKRKSDHITINLEKEVNSSLKTGLENYRFENNALPEIDYSEICLSQKFFAKEISSPILISSMTGGSSEAENLNIILAEAAQETGIALGVGSQRAAIEDPSLAKSFQIRKYAPDILLFANLGAIQLNYGYGLEECQKSVDMVEADALILHLNALQEALQPEGDTNFKNLLPKISEICAKLSVPVIVKEVGWGVSGKTAKRLLDAGVSAIDVAGAGGTSWSQVEMYRAESEAQKRLAASFIGWGIPTSESIVDVKLKNPNASIIASGGLRNGTDIAKCIVLGAKIGGLASPFLKTAHKSLRVTIDKIEEISNEIKICMFASGTKSIESLSKIELIKK